jgi:hypothetical protein
MKMRVLMLFMSLFAVTPAILGSAWAGSSEHRSAKAPIYANSRECELREAKRIAANKTQGTIKVQAQEARGVR